jgi:hypothetical protein
MQTQYRHVHAHKCLHSAGIEPATSCVVGEYSHHYAKSNDQTIHRDRHREATLFWLAQISNHKCITWRVVGSTLLGQSSFYYAIVKLVFRSAVSIETARGAGDSNSVLAQTQITLVSPYLFIKTIATVTLKVVAVGLIPGSDISS